MTSIYDDLNPDWEAPVLDGWEPWEPDEDVDVREGGCDYCGAPDVRENPEPFGGKHCCEACFVTLIGDDGGPPWRCGTPSIDSGPKLFAEGEPNRTEQLPSDARGGSDG